MGWLEYNVHVHPKPSFQNVIKVLIDFIEPFVETHRKLFKHWHYLIEPDRCRSTFIEIRVRFEGEERNLERIKRELVSALSQYSDEEHLTIPENETLGSHEGCHGGRDNTYKGAKSENFGKDWKSIVEILQIGSESAIEILRLGNGLVEQTSLNRYIRKVDHPYFLHLPANQLLVEP